MAEFSFPFDSKFIELSETGLPKGDRDGSAADYRKYDSDRFTNGVNVFEDPDSLKVVAGSGMTVDILPGSAYIQGARYEVDAAGKTLTLPNGNSQPRIDRIVVTMDDNEALRSCLGAVKAGTPAASPAAPALTRSIDALGETHQISLMRILVPANATNISQCTLIDERADTNVCGWSLSRRTPQPPMPGDAILQAEKGAANGVAPLDAGSKLLTAYLPTHSHGTADLPTASTSAAGISQLTSALNDTSETKALTAKGGKDLDDKIAITDSRGSAPILAGVSPNFTGAHSPAWTSIPTYKPFAILNTVDMPAGTTFNFDGLGAKPLKKLDGVTNDSLKAGFYWIAYNGTNFFAVRGGGGLELPDTIIGGTVPIHVQVSSFTMSTYTYQVAKTLPTIRKACTLTISFDASRVGSSELRSAVFKNGIMVAGTELITTGLTQHLRTVDVVCAVNDVITVQILNYNSLPSLNTFVTARAAWGDLAAKLAEILS